jgi:hypothetical protein
MQLNHLIINSINVGSSARSMDASVLNGIPFLPVRAESLCTIMALTKT